jgi:hypothetical protein
MDNAKNCDSYINSYSIIQGLVIRYCLYGNSHSGSENNGGGGDFDLLRNFWILKTENNF